MSWTRFHIECPVASRWKSRKSSVTIMHPEQITENDLVYPAPAPVTEIQPILDAENITLAWPRPDGRIDEYFIRWFPLDAPEQDLAKTIPGDIGTEGINRLVKVDSFVFSTC